jgi:uncharacterized protein (TIGR00725 family)
MQNLKVVGVMGSATDAHVGLASIAGRVIAKLGFHLLTGAGKGVMKEAAIAFTKVESRKGISIGIVRAKPDPDNSEVAKNPWEVNSLNDYVELAIKTHLPKSDDSDKSRNHINVLSADVVVVLPGGSGTYSEFKLAVEKYKKPIILFLGNEELDNKSVKQILGSYSSYPNLNVAANESELHEQLYSFL